MAGRFSVEAVFKAVDRITAPINRMQNRLGKFTRAASRDLYRINRQVDRMVGGLKKVAIAGTAAMALTGAAMADVIGTGADFEQTMVSAAVKFPGEIRKGSEAFKQLEDTARRVGGTTEFTATQAANGLNYLAMAGFNAEQSIAALPGLVNLATAGQVDLATASDIATDSLGAFNLMTKDAAQLQTNLARVSDVLALTSVRANTDIETMFEAIKDGAPVATAAGASVETIATMIGTMANAGIKGTRAGTALKNIFLSLSAPGSAAAKVMQRLHVKTTDASNGVRDAIAVFQDFTRATAELPEAQKMQAFDAIFGKIPIAAAINLTNAADSMVDFRKELEAGTGTTEKMASVMRDTLQGRLKSLSSAIESVKLRLFGMTSGPLSDVVDRMVAWTRANEDFIATKIGDVILSIVNNFDEIVATLKKIGVGLAIFMGLSAILKTFIAVMTAVNLVMALNPVGLIVLGVVALIAAFTALVVWVDDVAGSFDKLPGIIRVILAPLELLIKAIKFVKDNWGAVSGAASALGSFLGFGGGSDTQQATAAPQMVSPQERTARSVEESRTTSTSEVTIKDQTGRAEVTQGRLGPGLQLTHTGAF